MGYKNSFTKYNKTKLTYLQFKMQTDYSYKDIVKAIKKLGIKKGDIVAIRTDLRYLGNYIKRGKSEVLKAFYNAFVEIVDLKEGTLSVATSSTSIINTDIPFDIENTPSDVGVFTEYLRKKDGAIRSFHPFESCAAIGKEAKEICMNTSRHAFGPETPEARLIERDAICVSIGLPPPQTCSTVHHIEMAMGVPYRYPKEYIHPVVRNGIVKYEPFYRYAWYRECNIKRNGLKKIFKHFTDSGYKINKTSLGRGFVYSYSLSEFYRSTTKLMSKDIFVWLDEIPKVKPYRK